MASISDDCRVMELRRLGASDPMILLSTGVLVHELFRNSCLGPPFYVYHGARTPAGPLFIPLWDWCDTVVGVWRRVDGLEFIEFSIEAVDDYQILSRTEQGFWTTRFKFLYECDEPSETLHEAATAVGFRFLDRLVATRTKVDSQTETLARGEGWLRRLVAEVDSGTEVTS